MEIPQRGIFPGEWYTPNITTSRNIIRLACLFCKSLPFIPDEAVTSIIKVPELTEKGYFFARIAAADEKSELFGFCTLPTGANNSLYDFYPIDDLYQSVTLFRFMLSNSTLSEGEWLPGFETQFDNYKEKASGTLILSERIPAFLPFSSWDFVSNSQPIYKQLIDDLNPFTEEKDIQIFQIWNCRLSFSNRYKLYETIAVTDKKHFCRSYFLVRWAEEDSTNYVKAVAVNGSSSIIHDIWNEEIDNQPGFYLTTGNIIDYVRFFCWAIEAEEGQFVQPAQFEEFPFHIRPDDESCKKITALLSGRKELINLTRENKESFKIETLIIYGKNIFTAWFNIEGSKGLIEMTDDKPLIENLPFFINKFSSEYLPVLDYYFLSDDQKNKVEKNIQGQKKTDQAIVTENPDDIIFLLLDDLQKSLTDSGKKTDGAYFTSLLRGGSRSIEQLLLTESLVRNHFDIPPGSSSSRPEVVIKNCFFSNIVNLCGSSSINTTLKFVNCVFDQGFTARETAFSHSLIFENCVFYSREHGETPCIDLYLLRSEADILLYNCRIVGQVLAKSMHVEGNFSIAGCTISPYKSTKQVILKNLGNTDWHAIDKIHSKNDISPFNKEEILQLSNSSISGNLEIKGLVLSHTMKKELLELSNLITQKKNISDLLEAYLKQDSPFVTVVHGALSGNIILGAISATNIVVSGNVSFIGLATFGFAHFQNSQFDGDIKFRGYGDPYRSSVNFKSYGNLNFFNCQIRGMLDLSATDVDGEVALYKSVVQNYINLTYAKCEGLDMKYIEVHTGIFAYRNNIDSLERENLKVEGDINLSGANTNTLRLEGIRVSGILKVNTGTFGSIAIGYGFGPSRKINSEKLSKPLSLNCSEFSGLMLKSIQVQGDLNLSGLYIDFPKEMESPKIRKIQAEMGAYGCHISFSSIQGNLKLFDADNNHLITHEELSKYTDDINYHHRTVRTLRRSDHSYVRNGLLMQGNRVSGNIDMKNLLVKGDVDLTDTSSGLNIDFGATFKQMDGKSNETLLRTWCHSLIMPGVTANGNINFTGLRAKNIDASASTVKRKWIFIELCPKEVDNEKVIYQTHQALIQGPPPEDMSLSALNLTDAEGEELIISGDSLHNEGSGIDRNAAVLERASFNKLVIYDPEPCFNLSNASIRNWEFIALSKENGQLTGFKTADKVKNYQAILKKMKPFDKAAYINVEHLLRNKGKSDEANKTRRAMHRHEREYIVKRHPRLLKVVSNPQKLSSWLLPFLFLVVSGIGITSAWYYWGKPAGIAIAIIILVSLSIKLRKYTGNLFGELYGYGTRLPLLLAYWAFFVFITIILIRLNPESFERSKKEEVANVQPVGYAVQVSHRNINAIDIPLSDATHMALVHCTPLVNLGSSGSEAYVLKEGSRMRFYFWGMAVLSYLLLAGAFIGISNRISHSK